MTMVSLKPIEKGQEIFNDYGQLPRSDLLRRYGYVTDNYKPWDVVEIDVQAVVEVASAHNGLSGNQQETRASLPTLLSDEMLRMNSFNLQTIGTCSKMDMTCSASPAARLSNSTQAS